MPRGDGAGCRSYCPSCRLRRWYLSPGMAGTLKITFSRHLVFPYTTESPSRNAVELNLSLDTLLFCLWMLPKALCVADCLPPEQWSVHSGARAPLLFLQDYCTLMPVLSCISRRNQSPPIWWRMSSFLPLLVASSPDHMPVCVHMCFGAPLRTLIFDSFLCSLGPSISLR